MSRYRYRDDPVAFAHDVIAWPGDGHPTTYQDEVLAALATESRVAVRGPHGLGKTALASIAILWFAITREGEDWKIPTTASAWRQLERYLWPEIHKWVRLVRWDLLGRDPPEGLLSLALKMGGGEAFALASDNAALIEGAHADYLLYVFDEAREIPAATWDSAEGAFSTGDPSWLAISTPGAPNGRFYQIHARQPGYEDWWVRHVTVDEAIRAGRINPEWVEQRARQWGRDSAVFRNRVLGEFASSEENGVIPLEWVERAVERWRAWKDRDQGSLMRVGVDVARSGTDKTVRAYRREKGVSRLAYTAREDTMQTAGRVLADLRGTTAIAVVDVIGIGAGVVDRLREMGIKVVPHNAAAGSDRLDRSGELGFANLRAEAWWGLREQLDPAYGGELALPHDDQLIGDLTAPTWRVTSGGRIQIESKDDVKKRLGRSTDAADAVVMACWNPRPRRGGLLV